MLKKSEKVKMKVLVKEERLLGLIDVVAYGITFSYRILLLLFYYLIFFVVFYFVKVFGNCYARHNKI